MANTKVSEQQLSMLLSYMSKNHTADNILCYLQNIKFEQVTNLGKILSKITKVEILAEGFKIHSSDGTSTFIQHSSRLSNHDYSLSNYPKYGDAF